MQQSQAQTTTAHVCLLLVWQVPAKGYSSVQKQPLYKVDSVCGFMYDPAHATRCMLFHLLPEAQTGQQLFCSDKVSRMILTPEQIYALTLTVYTVMVNSK